MQLATVQRNGTGAMVATAQQLQWASSGHVAVPMAMLKLDVLLAPAMHGPVAHDT